MSGSPKLERKLRVACEVCADNVIAAVATAQSDAIEAVAVRSLATGTVMPGLTSANVPAVNALSSAITDAFAAVSTKHRDIIAVIPDGACRVALLEFDTLPQKPQEADSVVRFRLKKSLPFEVERARLSYDVRPADGLMRVTAVVALPTVIEEYEAAFRNAGFTPGYVIPSTLAALGLVDSTRPTLVIKLAADVTTIAMVHNDDLLLYRTIENGIGVELDPEQLADDVYPSLVFFQDTYGLKIERILIGGTQSFAPLANALESASGIRCQELVPAYALPASIAAAQKPLVAGTLGALIS